MTFQPSPDGHMAPTTPDLAEPAKTISTFYVARLSYRPTFCSVPGRSAIMPKTIDEWEVNEHYIAGSDVASGTIQSFQLQAKWPNFSLRYEHGIMDVSLKNQKTDYGSAQLLVHGSRIRGHVFDEASAQFQYRFGRSELSLGASYRNYRSDSHIWVATGRP